MLYLFAIGGNAFDKKALKGVASVVSRLHSKGNGIIITHGNGPQVGELAMFEHKPLSILTAQTQAELGAEIQKTLSSMIKNARIAVLPTRVIVKKNDKEFSNPTKPIGKFYSKREAETMKRKGYIMKKLIGGYRRVVPSPKPIEILETRLVEDLLSDGYIVIAAGGGGIAITKKGREIKFADAVIDKDRASSLLAIKIKADRLFILTNVNGAYLNFKKKNQEMIKRISYKKLKRYLAEKQFEEGSMKPKIESCIEFVRKTKKIAAIGNISDPLDVVNLNTTVIVP